MEPSEIEVQVAGQRHTRRIAVAVFRVPDAHAHRLGFIVKQVTPAAAVLIAMHVDAANLTESVRTEII